MAATALCNVVEPFDIERSFSHKASTTNIVTFKNIEFYPNTFVKNLYL